VVDIAKKLILSFFLNYVKISFSFYNMDCFEIHRNSNNGQYWAYASHFLYCSEAHGQVFFPELLKYLKNDESLFDALKELKSAFQKPFRNLLFKVRKMKLEALKFLFYVMC